MRALNPQTIRKAVQLALDEDLDHGDVTTSALFPLSIQARAAILAHQLKRLGRLAIQPIANLFNRSHIAFSGLVVKRLGNLAQFGRILCRNSP